MLCILDDAVSDPDPVSVATAVAGTGGDGGEVAVAAACLGAVAPAAACDGAAAMPVWPHECRMIVPRRGRRFRSRSPK